MALGLALISNILHGAADQVENHGHVIVPFAKCLLVTVLPPV
jgi:hypothetical protein